MPETPALPTLAAIQQTRQQLAGLLPPTPLVRFEAEGLASQIYLKLENLQPTGSFKVRGAGSALYHALEECRKDGIWTASAGNMALGLAWHARRLGVPCTAVVPEDAPAAKLDALTHLGARYLKLPFCDYQQIQCTHISPGLKGRLVHPFADTAVMAGNAVIGLEILEQLPEVDAILVPYGGGGLSCGIAATLRQARPQVRVFACEVATAAPLATSFSAGQLLETSFTPSFISGIGAPFVFPQMWPLAHDLLDGVIVVSLEEVAQAMRALAVRSRVVAEGAGAVALAAALSGQAPSGKLACLVTGGNIDLAKFIPILQGRIP